MPDSMFEPSDEKLLREMYGEDAEKAGTAPRAAAPEAREEEPRAQEARDTETLHRRRRAFAARRRQRQQSQAAYLAMEEKRRREDRQAGAARKRMMAVGAVCLALLVLTTALTASGGGTSLVRRLFPAAYTDRARQWNSLGQYARTRAFLRANDIYGYTARDTEDALTSAAAQAEFAGLYEDVFQNWAEACWHWAVDEDPDWAETCVSIAVGSASSVLEPDYYQVELPAELTERCRYGVTLFLEDAGVAQQWIDALCGDDYSARYDAEEEIERHLNGLLASQAVPCLEALGYTVEPQAGEGDAS